jgi:hypothetical protein
MLHMQHAQAAIILMSQPIAEPKIEFPAADREHKRQLERVRDSLLLRPEPRGAYSREA